MNWCAKSLAEVDAELNKIKFLFNWEEMKGVDCAC